MAPGLTESTSASPSPSSPPRKRRTVEPESPDDVVAVPRPLVSASLTMCVHAFDVLMAALRQTEPPPVPTAVPDRDDCAIFVTWSKQTEARDRVMRRRGAAEFRLRGCIGTLAPTGLRQGLRLYTLTSAFNDRRFAPIELHETAHLQVSVSILSDFEEASGGIFDWHIGVHGITISFLAGADKQSFSATFLPEVAKEQGWDHRQCVTSLIRKSGYNGIIDERLLDSISTTRYVTSKLSLGYAEYLELTTTNAHCFPPPEPIV